ncbi:hypothetical protein DFH87_001757 [Clostridium saccharobutylicum]|nr:hypothetical protein [Clostridium saccharobutylicum]
MNAQLETFDDLEKDFIKNYNVSEPVGDEENKDEDNSIAEYAATEEKFEAEQGIDSAILSDELNEIKSFFVEGE